MRSLARVTAENFDRFVEEIIAIEKVSFPSPWTVDAFREEMNRSFSALWVFLEDEVVRGYLCCWFMAEEVHLMNIAVHPQRRGQGIGRTLLAKMISAGIRAGAQGAVLEVRPSNRPARALYREAGFQEIGRRRKYYRETGEDAILMMLQLEPENDAEALTAGDIV